jgi:precorrin-2 methylase
LGSLEPDMKKKLSIFLLLQLCCVLFSVLAFSSQAEMQIFSIGGLVQSPIQVTLNDLLQFKQEVIPANKGGNPKEEKALQYGAVPLRSLLELAKIQEPVQNLAVSVKNSSTEQIVLSWGELFLHERNHIFIAGSVNSLDDRILKDLPVLVLVRDNKVEISLKKITHIEVTSIADFKSNPANIRKAALPETLTGPMIQTESARGYALSFILEKLDLELGQTDILNVVAGSSNSVISVEELDSHASPLIVPHKAEAQKETIYNLVFPEDGNRDRWLENIEVIEIIGLKQKPTLYVVGVGCGDPNLLTNEAISIIGKADLFVGKDDYQKRYAGYIAGKPVLFDPFMQLARYQKARHPELTDSEAEEKADAVYADNIQTLRKALKEEKVVALLEPGDPTLYGGWRNWLSDYIPQDQLTVIAGMSSFSVSNAILGEYDLTQKPIIIAEPEELKADESLIQSAAQNGNVIAIFMGLNRMKALVPLLGKYFLPETPLIVVYHAGIAGGEHRIETSLSKAIEATAAEKENFLGLIYVGRNLSDSEKPRQ